MDLSGPLCGCWVAAWNSAALCVFFTGCIIPLCMTPQGGLDARACFYRCFNSLLLSTVPEHGGFDVAKFLYSFGPRLSRPETTMAHSSDWGHSNSSGF